MSAADGSRQASLVRPLAVVAFGGNALLRAEDMGTVDEQKERADEAAVWLVDFARRGHDLVVVHGNGPQVGQVLIQMEEAATKVPPGSLDVAVAQTEGSIGFLLETALRNRFLEVAAEEGGGGGGAGGHGRDEPEPAVFTVLTLVVVDGDDPGFRKPTKPIGPYFSRWRAEALQRDHGWQMVEGDAGRGWRKVVASPRPLEVLGVAGLRDLLGRGNVVIAGGGGGIPVVRGAGGRLTGVEAVIDKDFTSSLLARDLAADLFINLTDVPEIRRDFGTEDEEPIRELPLIDARKLLALGQFPAGSMGPKVEAGIEFVAATGKKVLVTDVDHLAEALAGEGGTAIVPDGE